MPASSSSAPSTPATVATENNNNNASAADAALAASSQLDLDGQSAAQQQQHGLYGQRGYGSSYGGYGGGMFNRGGYGGYGSYGGYGGYGGMYGGGMYGGGMYGGGGPFGMFGPMANPDPDKDPMPPGLRHLENLMYSFGRITQMLEMNFEVLQHFLGSMVALIEKLRAMYRDACQLSSTVKRQSLEFGESSISTVREARTRFRRHPIASIALIGLALSVLLRFARNLRGALGVHPGGRRRLTQRGGVGGPPGLEGAFASTALDAAWR